MLPIYWISYHYASDHSRAKQFKKKYEKFSKLLPTKHHALDVYESQKQKSDFRGRGIPAKKDEMILQAHFEVIERARKEGYDHIMILEDKVSVLDLPNFKTFLTNFQRPLSNWDILFLGGYIEEHDIPSSEKEWISGHSRNHFAYILNLKNNLDLDLGYGDWGKQLHDLEDSFYRREFLVVPQFYNYEKGLMKETAKGLSMAQIDEVDGINQIKLKMDYIPEDKLPSVTLLTILDNARSWWPLLIMNLNNLDYSTQKMEWIILDVSQNENDQVEDLLPKKRGRPGGWHLKYLYRPEFNGFSFEDCAEALKDEDAIEHNFVVELHPECFYPVFSIHSRIKTAMKYSRYGFFGSTEVQMYSLQRDHTYITGSSDKLEFEVGSRLLCLKRDWKNKMRVPAQFVSRLIDYKGRDDERLYQGDDKFPDYLQEEDFFCDLVLIIDDLRKEYIKGGKI